MGPMPAESFHLGTGPMDYDESSRLESFLDMLQRRRTSGSQQRPRLFVDSSSAHWAYVWELKTMGRGKKMLKSTSTRKSSTKKLVLTTTMRLREVENPTATKKKVQHRSTSPTRTSIETSVTAKECATPSTVRNSKAVTMTGTLYPSVLTAEDEEAQSTSNSSGLRNKLLTARQLESGIEQLPDASTIPVELFGINVTWLSDSTTSYLDLSRMLKTNPTSMHCLQSKQSVLLSTQRTDGPRTHHCLERRSENVLMALRTIAYPKVNLPSTSSRQHRYRSIVAMDALSTNVYPIYSKSVRNLDPYGCTYTVRSKRYRIHGLYVQRLEGLKQYASPTACRTSVFHEPESSSSSLERFE